MALSYQNYTGDSVTDTFAIPFTYTDTSEISVTVDGVAETGLTFPSTSSVQLTSAPATSTLVQVRRNTDLTARAVDYVSGSVLTEEDLDNANIQVFHAAQEAVDKASDGITLDNDDKWDAQNKIIKNVADPVDNTDAVNKQFISTNLPNITTVANISTDVTTVAGISSDVTAVAADATDIGTVSTNIASVNTVATNINDVITVANDLNEAISEIETAADDLNEAVSEIDTVASNIANVNAVGASMTNVTTVALNVAKVNTVANNDANVTTVAGISGDVTTVASNNANVTAVAGNATNINTVAANNANVTTVAGISANVTTVANDTVDIGTVASNIADVNTVAANNTNITAVAADATDIGTVASNIANVNAVGGDITNVNTVAANLTDVNAFADTYFISATAPSSPTEGDLWFDTTNDVMKVYDGSGFVNAGSSVNGTSERQTYTATSGQTSFAATYDAGYVDVYLNGVKLINGTDFTATDGSNVVLTTGAALNDTVDIVAFGTFNLLNLDISSDTTPHLGGNLDTNGNDITGTGNIDIAGNIELAKDAPQIDFNDTAGGTQVDYRLKVDAGEFSITDVTNSYEQVEIAGGIVKLRHNGSTKVSTSASGIDVTGTVTADNIGINETTPSAKLDVNGQALIGDIIGSSPNITNFISGGAPPQLVAGWSIPAITWTPDAATEAVFSRDGGMNVDILAASTSSSALQFSDEDDENVGRIMYTHTDDSMRFQTNGSEKMRILASGGITFNGDTATANALDDYEEGTWLPSFSFTNGNGTSTIGNRAATYLKVGNFVFINGYITLATKGTASGDCRVAAIPFTPRNTSNLLQLCNIGINQTVSGQDFDGDFNIWGQLAPNDATLRIFALTGGGNVNQLNAVHVKDNTQIRFSCWFAV